MDLEKLAEKHLNEKLNDLGVGIPKYKHLAINLMVRYAEDVLRINGSSKEDVNKQFEPVEYTDALKCWDTGMIDLNRRNGTFEFNDVRLRDCSLHFSQSTGEYYVQYKDEKFPFFDIYNLR